MNGSDMAMVIALQNKSAEKLTTSGGLSDAGKLLGIKDDGSVGAVELTVGQGEVAVDSTLTVDGAAANAKTVGDRLSADESALSAVNESLQHINLLGTSPTIECTAGGSTLTAVAIASVTLKAGKYFLQWTQTETSPTDGYSRFGLRIKKPDNTYIYATTGNVWSGAGTYVWELDLDVDGSYDVAWVYKTLTVSATASNFYLYSAKSQLGYMHQSKADQGTTYTKTEVDAAISECSQEQTEQVLNAFPTDTASGAVASFSDGAELPVKDLTVTVTATQSGSGDPSPDNVRPISGWTGATITRNDGTAGSNEETYAVDWTSEAGTVYGGSLDVTTGVLTVTHGTTTYNGSETILVAEVSAYRYFTIGTVLPTTAWENNIISNVFPKNASGATGKRIQLDSASRLRLVVDLDDTDFETVDDVKTFLEATNLIVVYPLAESTTVQLTAQEVTTLLGDNNIFADTGDSSVTYRADPTLYVNRKIAEAISALS